MRITKTYRFEASHRLPHHVGKCFNLHGHSYRLDVSIAGPLHMAGPSAGMVMDFADLSTIIKDHVIEKLDHTHLNEILENPTCERLLVWIWAALVDQLAGLDSMTLWETDAARARLDRGDAETAL